MHPATWPAVYSTSRIVVGQRRVAIMNLAHHCRKYPPFTFIFVTMMCVTNSHPFHVSPLEATQAATPLMPHNHLLPVRDRAVLGGVGVPPAALHWVKVGARCKDASCIPFSHILSHQQHGVSSNAVSAVRAHSRMLPNQQRYSCSARPSKLWRQCPPIDVHWII